MHQQDGVNEYGVQKANSFTHARHSSSAQWPPLNGRRGESLSLVAILSAVEIARSASMPPTINVYLTSQLLTQVGVVDDTRNLHWMAKEQITGGRSELLEGTVNTERRISVCLNTPNKCRSYWLACTGPTNIARSPCFFGHQSKFDVNRQWSSLGFLSTSG